MEHFVRLVDRASMLPHSTQSLKRMIVSHMDRDDFDQVVSFFTDLEAGMQCFPSLLHLVNRSSW